jgi:hypothetical protein
MARGKGVSAAAFAAALLASGAARACGAPNYRGFTGIDQQAVDAVTTWLAAQK